MTDLNRSARKIREEDLLNLSNEEIVFLIKNRTKSIGEHTDRLEELTGDNFNLDERLKITLFAMDNVLELTLLIKNHNKRNEAYDDMDTIHECENILNRFKEAVTKTGS